MPKFVIFSVRPPDRTRPGEHEWEAFDSFIEAQTALNSYAASYPWNTYHFARVLETRVKTVEKQPVEKDHE